MEGRGLEGVMIGAGPPGAPVLSSLEVDDESGGLGAASLGLRTAKGTSIESPARWVKV